MVDVPSPVDTAHHRSALVHDPHHAVLTGDYISIRIPVRRYRNRDKMTGIHVRGQCVEVDPPKRRIPQVTVLIVPVHLLPPIDIQEISPLRHIRTEEQLRILLLQSLAHRLKIKHKLTRLPKRIVPKYLEPLSPLLHILFLEGALFSFESCVTQTKPICLRPQLLETVCLDPVSPVQLLDLAPIKLSQESSIPADPFFIETARCDRIPHAAHGNDLFCLSFPCHQTTLTAFAVAVHNALHMLLHGSSRLFGPVFIPLTGPAIRIYRFLSIDGWTIPDMRIQIVPVHVQQQEVIRKPMGSGGFSHILLHLYVLAERPCLVALLKILPGLGVKHHTVEAKPFDQCHRLIDKSLVVIGRAVEITEDHINIRPVVCRTDHVLSSSFCRTFFPQFHNLLRHSLQSRLTPVETSYPYTGSIASIKRSAVVNASPVTVSAQP